LNQTDLIPNCIYLLKQCYTTYLLSHDTLIAAEISDLHPHRFLVCFDEFIANAHEHLKAHVRLGHIRHNGINILLSAAEQIDDGLVGLSLIVIDLVKGLLDGVSKINLRPLWCVNGLR
jgi:hypothetical protein